MTTIIYGLKTSTEVLTQKIIDTLPHCERITVSIDGRSASGKTTLAESVRRSLGAWGEECNVFHIDDFFLPRSMRTEERLSEIGGNFHRERFLSEIISGIESGAPFSFRPYDCKADALCASVQVSPKKISIIEGSYSSHPDLFCHYDLSVFCLVDREEQIERIRARETREGAKNFLEKWIPLEEKYFSSRGAEQISTFVFKL